MDQYIGKLLDNRYEILELIGVGGMAKVYKARCHRLNRLVAIKILRDDLAQDAELRRRFHDESQAVAMLSHPNIVAVYDVSRSADLEYIVMELIDGINLKQYMQKRGNKLNWREALHFITQIVKALGHAHSRGIIHRDIKPHNIMVLRDGSVKVADFGIARLASAGHSTLTQETLGSVHYISPEQARGSHIDARSDLYSAGVVLYEMITGRLPFEGDSPVSVAIQHINSIPLSPRELNPEIPEALEAITMKAMAPNPEDRYLSADAMLTDLEEFRKNPNINFDYNVNEFSLSEEQEPEERTQVVQVSSVSRAHREHEREHEHEPERPTYQHRRSQHMSRREDDYDDYEEYEPRHAPSWPIYLAVVLILAFTVGIFYFLYTSFLKDLLNPAPSYTIPSLVGELYEEAAADKELLQNFVLVQGSSVTSDEPAGTILRQSPNANTETIDPNAEITVTVSSGPEQIIMPPLEQKTYNEAMALLQNMGLSVPVPEYQFDDEVPYNHIISYTPLPDTVLRLGDEVHLVVSKGPETRTTQVPLFIGQNEEWCRNKAALFHLEIELIPVWSDEVAEGLVIDQNPVAMTDVPEGTKISLQISKGVDPSTLPQQTTKTFYIDLPAVQPPAPGDPEPSTEISITVTENGSTIWAYSANSALEVTVPCTVTGSGIKTYEIYFDGTYHHSETVNFDS